MGLDCESEVIVRVPFGLPFCIDWLRDGRLPIVTGRESLLLRREPDGTLVTHADLHGLPAAGWNEIVVDARGNAYVNGAHRRWRNALRGDYSVGVGGSDPALRWRRLSPGARAFRHLSRSAVR